MEIGVNARLLVQPYTGIAQYTRNLFREIAKIDPENNYIMVVPSALPQKLMAEFPKNVRFKVLPEKHFPSAGMRKVWWEQISVPALFDRLKVDVAFFTYPCNPWNSSWYKLGIKTYVTIHDCIPWMHKGYKNGLLSRMYHARTRKAAKLADKVFTVSGASAEDIVKVCGVPEKKIQVVYNDCSEAYKTPLDEKFAEEVLRRFSLKPNGYILYVGGYDKRKNVEQLIKDHAEFGEVPLVLAGGKLHKNSLYGSFDLKSAGNVIKTGFLPEDDLAALYRGSLGFINLSKAEGFNITILEAANCGAAMILSDIPVHREVAEDAALYVKGSSVSAMKKLMNDELRDDLKKAGLRLAKKYSIKKYAKIVHSMLFS